MFFLPKLASKASPKQGIKTGDNDRFLRFWQEISASKAVLFGAPSSQLKWFPCTKGGGYRKWYGNHDYVLNWENEGYEIRHFVNDAGRLRSRPQNIDYFFKPGITWSGASSTNLAMRIFQKVLPSRARVSVLSDDEKGALPPTHIELVRDACALADEFTHLDYSEGSIADLPLAEVVDRSGAET